VDPTPEQIDRAIAWYQAHRAEVAAAMPIGYPGGTYYPPALDALDQAVAVYQSGKFSPTLSRAYILRPCRHFYRALQCQSQS